MFSSSRRALCLSLAVITGALSVGAAVAAGAAKAPTAASVLALTKSALNTERGVHIVVTTINDKVKSSVVADIGTNSGTETYTSGAETFTISVTPTYAYLSGSKTGLVDIMGLSAAQQKKIGSQTLKMKKGTAQYTSFYTNLTAAAYSELLPAVKGTTLLSARDKSTNGYQLSWSTKATSTAPKTHSVMVVSSGSKPLPIKETIRTSEGSSKTTFTRWGESVSIKVPTNTIAYSKVFSS
ncbi:MAG TPA: hypothetical protein VMF33_03115 [Acidimicrobiales bacterium]|nr:hypothetical protein [Acidimicrobiales bacterium]